MKKIDITKHVLVPEHTKLNEKEIEALFKHYNILGSNLPKILKADPAIEHLSPQEGDIIKIVRKSPTAGVAVFYRVVANA